MKLHSFLDITYFGIIYSVNVITGNRRSVTLRALGGLRNIKGLEGDTMRIVVALLLSVTVSIGLGCSGSVGMGKKSSASDTCKCWSCPFDQQIYCKIPDSHPYCKWLLFSCEGPRPEECCDE